MITSANFSYSLVTDEVGIDFYCNGNYVSMVVCPITECQLFVSDTNSHWIRFTDHYYFSVLIPESVYHQLTHELNSAYDLRVVK